MSYVSSYHLCVFSTKERRPLITPEFRERLWPFLGGIARQNNMKATEIGGVGDHVHTLLSIPSTMPVSKAIPPRLSPADALTCSENQRFFPADFSPPSSGPSVDAGSKSILVCIFI